MVASTFYNKVAIHPISMIHTPSAMVTTRLLWKDSATMGACTPTTITTNLIQPEKDTEMRVLWAYDRVLMKMIQSNVVTWRKSNIKGEIPFAILWSLNHLLLFRDQLTGLIWISKLSQVSCAFALITCKLQLLLRTQTNKYSLVITLWPMILCK